MAIDFVNLVKLQAWLGFEGGEGVREAFGAELGIGGAELEVEMRLGGVAGIAEQAEDLAAVDVVADLDVAHDMRLDAIFDMRRLAREAILRLQADHRIGGYHQFHERLLGRLGRPHRVLVSTNRRRGGRWVHGWGGR